MTEAHANGSLSVVVPMEDMTAILTQLWKSRHTEPHIGKLYEKYKACLLYTSPSPRDGLLSRMPSSA